MLVGGAGFIGHNLALRLKQAGHTVTVIDGLNVNNLYALDDERLKRIIYERLDLLHAQGIPFICADARDYDMMSNLMSSLKTDVIVHLAAIAHLNRANKNPYTTFDHSLRTLENSLDVGHNIGVERIIYLSSSTAYGDFPADTVTEETPLNPRGIYGALKAAGELMVKAYKEACNLDYCIVRPSALYGPRCVSNRVIQIFIERLLREQDKPLILRGDESLDFTCIHDFVAGVQLCIEKPEALGETFNITYGQSRKVSEVVDILREYFPDLRVEKQDFDEERPHRGTLSVDKAKKLLGYAPEWPIERGIPDYFSWYKERGDERIAETHFGESVARA